MRTILLVLMLLSCNLQNNRNCLILDAFLGLATVLTVRKILTVGYLLLTVISFWILLSVTIILLMPFGYLFLRVGDSFLRKPYPRYLHFPCCIFAYKEKRTNAVSCLWAFSMLECLGATLAHVTPVVQSKGEVALATVAARGMS